MLFLITTKLTNIKICVILIEKQEVVLQKVRQQEDEKNLVLILVLKCIAGQLGSTSGIVLNWQSWGNVRF